LIWEESDTQGCLIAYNFFLTRRLFSPNTNKVGDKVSFIAELAVKHNTPTYLL